MSDTTTAAVAAPAAPAAPARRPATTRELALWSIAVILALFIGVFALLVTVGVMNKSLTFDEAKGLCLAVLPSPSVLLAICVGML